MIFENCVNILFPNNFLLVSFSNYKWFPPISISACKIVIFLLSISTASIGLYSFIDNSFLFFPLAPSHFWKEHYGLMVVFFFSVL